MKVSELREILEGVDGDLKIVLSQDEELNGLEIPEVAEVGDAIVHSYNQIDMIHPDYLKNGEFDPEDTQEVLLISP